MSTTKQQNRHPQVAEHAGLRGLLLTAGVAVTGALGYGIAVGLARATEYAEKVEEDAYCHPTDVRARADRLPPEPVANDS